MSSRHSKFLRQKEGIYLKKYYFFLQDADFQTFVFLI